MNWGLDDNKNRVLFALLCVAVLIGWMIAAALARTALHYTKRDRLAVGVFLLFLATVAALGSPLAAFVVYFIANFRLGP